MVIPKAQSPHIDRMAVVLYDGAIDDVLEAVVGFAKHVDDLEI